MKKNTMDVIWSRYEVVDGGCWQWTGGVGANGYSKVKVGGKCLSGHRIAYTLTKGEPRGVVCHSCDNPLCINPEHLFDGTCADNSSDMVSKMRHTNIIGENHWKTKLSDNDVKQVRALLSEGLSQQKIADMFGVNQTQISRIKRGTSRTYA